jgi:hypothetical protein
MDLRQFESDAGGSAPIAPAVPSVGYASAGNPGTATPASKPGPWWFHQIAEEMRNVIVGAGLTPSHVTLTQLWTAIQAQATVYASNAEVQTGVLTNKAVNPAALASFAKVLAANGYQRFPGGLILQWGKLTSVNMDNDVVAMAVTFPIAFPTAFLSIQLTVGIGTNTTRNLAPYSAAETTSGFNLYIDKDAVEDIIVGNVYYLAVGY